MSIAGTFLYYAREVDPCILSSKNESNIHQAMPTSKTNNKMYMLMSYAHAYPNTKMRYYTIGMCLCIDSESSHLVLSKRHSSDMDQYFSVINHHDQIFNQYQWNFFHFERIFYASQRHTIYYSSRRLCDYQQWKNDYNHYHYYGRVSTQAASHSNQN